jgi:hypothetical protein
MVYRKGTAPEYVTTKINHRQTKWQQRAKNDRKAANLKSPFQI